MILIFLIIVVIICILREYKEGFANWTGGWDWDFSYPTRVYNPTRNMSYDLRGESVIYPDYYLVTPVGVHPNYFHPSNDPYRAKCYCEADYSRKNVFKNQEQNKTQEQNQNQDQNKTQETVPIRLVPIHSAGPFLQSTMYPHTRYYYG